MDERKLRQAISQKKADINMNKEMCREEMDDASLTDAMNFYNGELNSLTWVLEQLSIPEASSLIEVGDAQVRKSRKSPVRARKA